MVGGIIVGYGRMRKGVSGQSHESGGKGVSTACWSHGPSRQSWRVWERTERKAGLAGHEELRGRVGGGDGQRGRLWVLNWVPVRASSRVPVTESVSNLDELSVVGDSDFVSPSLLLPYVE